MDIIEWTGIDTSSTINNIDMLHFEGLLKVYISNTTVNFAVSAHSYL